MPKRRQHHTPAGIHRRASGGGPSPLPAAHPQATQDTAAPSSRMGARQSQSSDLSGGVMFPPGEPLRPAVGIAPGDGAPRQWAYPVGYNIAQRPRATEQTSFEQLRNLAALYDGVQICERVYFDLLGRLEPRVVPRGELLAEGEPVGAPRWREPARRIEAFLESRGAWLRLPVAAAFAASGIARQRLWLWDAIGCVGPCSSGDGNGACLPGRLPSRRSVSFSYSMRGTSTWGDGYIPTNAVGRCLLRG